MADPFANPPTDPTGWMRHLIEETQRLGEVIVDEGKENRAAHADLVKQIAALDKKQSLTDKDLKMLIAKISTAVSVAVAGAAWLLKSGLLTALL